MIGELFFSFRRTIEDFCGAASVTRGCVWKEGILSAILLHEPLPSETFSTFRGKGCLLSQSHKVRVLTSVLPVCES